MFASFTSDLPWQYCNNEFNDGWAAIWGKIQMWNRSVKRADSEQWFTVTKPGAHLRIVQELLLRDCVQGVRGDEGELDWQQHHLPQQVKRCHYHQWQGDERAPAWLHHPMLSPESSQGSHYNCHRTCITEESMLAPFRADVQKWYGSTKKVILQPIDNFSSIQIETQTIRKETQRWARRTVQWCLASTPTSPSVTRLKMLQLRLQPAGFDSIAKSFQFFPW